MNCADCMERLDSFLDRELNDEELAQVRLHLELCPPCEEVFTLRADVKRLVKTCCEEQTGASQQLRDRLRKMMA
jgi:mycothiol system anti-sigma-R factor